VPLLMKKDWASHHCTGRELRNVLRLDRQIIYTEARNRACREPLQASKMLVFLY